MKIVTVIAAYDERQNVAVLSSRLVAVLDEIPGATWQMIYVVDGVDGTRELLEQTAAARGWPVRVLWHERPRGLGRAFRAGFAAVPPDADVVVTMDADLNHQPEEVPRLVAELVDRDLDVLVGSRFIAGSSVRGTPLWKRLLSGVMNRIMRLLYGLRVRDKTSGYRVYRRQALDDLSFRNDQFAFLPEMLILANEAGMRIGESPIQFLARVEGRSKMKIMATSASYLSLMLTRLNPGRGGGRQRRARDREAARRKDGQIGVGP